MLRIYPCQILTNHGPETVSHTKNLSPIGFSLLKSKFHSLFFNSKSAKKKITKRSFVAKSKSNIFFLSMREVFRVNLWHEWRRLADDIPKESSRNFQKVFLKKTYIAFDLEKLMAIVPSQKDIS